MMGLLADLIERLFGGLTGTEPSQGNPNIPVRIEVKWKGNGMADVVEGQTRGFEIKGFNKAGKEVPLKDAATVTVANATLASATVQSNGKNGVLTGVLEGSTTLNAVSGSLTDSEPITVLPDLVPTRIEVVFGVVA